MTITATMASATSGYRHASHSNESIPRNPITE